MGCARRWRAGPSGDLDPLEGGDALVVANLIAAAARKSARSI
jgi:hypothetical protein